MWLFYVCALIPVFIGAALWYFDKEIKWFAWLSGTAAAFALAGIFQLIAINGMTGDVETWSGQIVKTSYYPAWVEQWEEEHSETTTDSKGNSHTRRWYTTEYDHHSEHWTVSRDFGKITDEQDVDYPIYSDLSRKFGGRSYEDGQQSLDHGMDEGHRISGDRSIYSVSDQTGYVSPVTTTRSFENRVKAAPTIFSFSEVPTNIAVYPWPENPDWMHSDRLLGTASVLIDHYKWDCMNASLGPRKRVNVIMVGFGNESEDYAHYQQAKFIGGKKNDLVICFGGATRTSPPTWVYVFGWTESGLVKQNITSLMLSQPVNDDLIPLISHEISMNYVIKDWHKFDYITVEPPSWSYWVYFIVLLLTQGGLYYAFHVYGVNQEWQGRSRWSY